MSQLMRLWYLSHRWPAKGQSLRCLHTWTMEADEGSDQKADIYPTVWLCMRFWRMNLRRTKSAKISWVGSNICPLSPSTAKCTVLYHNLIKRILLFFFLFCSEHNFDSLDNWPKKNSNMLQNERTPNTYQPLQMYRLIHYICCFYTVMQYEPCHKKTCLRGLRPGKSQTGLLS